MENTNKRFFGVEAFARMALFVIYFWFGVLKVVGGSPAEELVHHLCEITIGLFFDDSWFIPFFGGFECLLGVSFLFTRLTKFTIYVLWAHMAMTVLPLIVLPNESWQSLLTPTLVGQYIIKNLSILALSFYLIRDTD